MRKFTQYEKTHFHSNSATPSFGAYPFTIHLFVTYQPLTNHLPDTNLIWYACGQYIREASGLRHAFILATQQGIPMMKSKTRCSCMSMYILARCWAGFAVREIEGGDEHESTGHCR